MARKILIKTKHFTLRNPRLSDAEDLAKNLNNMKIIRNLANIPYPYKLIDAKQWLDKNIKEQSKKQPRIISLGIEIDNEFVGNVGFDNIVPGHKALSGTG
jgi:RimJ/RimL family protein N-acetyltransferase